MVDQQHYKKKKTGLKKKRKENAIVGDICLEIIEEEAIIKRIYGRVYERYAKKQCRSFNYENNDVKHMFYLCKYF